MKTAIAAVILGVLSLIIWDFTFGANNPASNVKDNTHMISSDDRYFTREQDVETGMVIQVSPLDGADDHADTGMVALLVKTPKSEPSRIPLMVFARATDNYKTNDTVTIERKYINDFSSGYYVRFVAKKK